MSESEEGQLGHCGTFSVKSLGPLTFLDPVRGFPFLWQQRGPRWLPLHGSMS